MHLSTTDEMKKKKKSHRYDTTEKSWSLQKNSQQVRAITHIIIVAFYEKKWIMPLFKILKKNK
jgi:hypothetical protein